MNHRLKTIFFLFLLCLAAWGDNLGYTKFTPLRIGLDLDYAPLEYVDKDGLPQGLDVDLTQELMKRLDVPYTYSPNNWENISGDVINGRVDLAMMVYSPYRRNLVNYSRAVFRLYYQAVYRVNEIGEQFDMRHMEGKNIAYMSSRPITDTLSRAGAVLHVVRDLPKALRDLSSGKYDAVICFRYQARYHIKEQGLENLIAEDLTLTPREYCYVSKNQQLINAINRELDLMEKDGVIDEVYGDYISQLGTFSVPKWIWYMLGIVLVLFLAITVVLQLVHAKQLRHEMLRAQRSERLKTVFLANVSHALRTPLNAIIGFSDMLSSMDMSMLSPEDQQQMLGMINSNGKQLLYFINELLQLSDIEGGGLQFQRIDTDIQASMEGFRLELQPQVAEGVEVKIESPHKSCIATLDPNLMRIVVMHMLTNAAKHTQQGSITIFYEKRKEGLYIAVTDTGEGIPDELKENIFTLLNDKNTFVQEETPGLGLSICKAIVDAANGKIGVESKHGEGSTFWHSIPVKVQVD